MKDVAGYIYITLKHIVNLLDINFINVTRYFILFQVFMKYNNL